MHQIDSVFNFLGRTSTDPPRGPRSLTDLRLSGVASPRIWEGPKCLIFGE